VILKPTLFQDIDGVINVLPKNKGNLDKRPHLRVWGEWRTLEINGYTITYSPELIAHLNRISQKAHTIWLTTWKEEARRDFAPAVGLNSFPVASPQGREDPWFSGAKAFNEGPQNRWWKLNAILEHLDSTGTPFIWLDDDLRSHMKQLLKRKMHDSGKSGLMLIPFENTGMTSEHIKQIDDFIDSL
jgi:hypothetical protein